MSSDESGIDDSTGSNDVAIRLKLVRELYGVSQRELAKRAGVTNSNISMIELGQVSPSIQSLERILSVIPVSLSAFFSFQRSSSINIVRSGLPDSLFPLNKDLQSQLHCKSIVVPVNTSHSLEVSDGDSCGVVVVGIAQLKMIAATESLAVGDSFYISSHQLHQFTNTGEVPLKLFICSNFGRSR